MMKYLLLPGDKNQYFPVYAVGLGMAVYCLELGYIRKYIPVGP